MIKFDDVTMSLEVSRRTEVVEIEKFENSNREEDRFRLNNASRENGD